MAPAVGTCAHTLVGSGLCSKRPALQADISLSGTQHETLLIGGTLEFGRVVRRHRKAPAGELDLAGEPYGRSHLKPGPPTFRSQPLFPPRCSSPALQWRPVRGADSQRQPGRTTIALSQFLFEKSWCRWWRQRSGSRSRLRGCFALDATLPVSSSATIAKSSRTERSYESTRRTFAKLWDCRPARSTRKKAARRSLDVSRW